MNSNMPKIRDDAGSGSVSNDDLHGNDDVDDVIDYAKPENYEGTKVSMRRYLISHHHHPSMASNWRDRGGSSGVTVSNHTKGKVTSNGQDDKRVLPPIWNSGHGLRGNYFRKFTPDDKRTDLGGLTEKEKEEEEEIIESSTHLEDVRCLESSSERQKARNQFRRIIKSILIILRWTATVEKGERRIPGDAIVRSPSQKTFTDIASELKTTDDDDDQLTFDPNSFRVTREKMITNELRRILTTSSSTRTQREIETAVHGLEYLEAFAEYPLHLREKLSRVGWFQQVDPKRVILKQGHPPENFYFVLFGQAIVQFMETDPVTGRKRCRMASVLRRGDSFGELALLHSTRRTATVVSDGVVQLLSIGREDFFQIIMGQSPDGSIPEHIRFLSSMDFMEDWPMHLLTKQPDKCMFLYFKRGTAIVKDSTKSDWIYVVKEGSCRVLKRLTAVAPRNSHPQRRKRSVVVEERRRRRRYQPTLDSSSFAFANIIRDASMCTKTSRTHNDLTSLPSIDQQPKGDGAKRRLRRYSCARIPSDVSRTFPDSGSERPKSEKEASVFIEVEVLQVHGVFGLRNINFGADFDRAAGVEASFSLVSNGAECVMLSKKFFLDHSTVAIRRRIERQVRPYPDDEVLQENLQTQVNWNAFKRRLIRSCVMTSCPGRRCRHS